MSATFYYFILLVALSSSMPAVKFKFNDAKETTYTVSLGARTDIDCTTDDQDAQVTLWKLIPPKKKVQIVASPNVIVNKGFFYIQDTFSNDFGNYQCQAVDKLGNKITKKVNIKLDTSDTSLVMNPERNVLTVIAGNSFKLTCETSNLGSDIIKWAFKHVLQKPQHSDYTINEYSVGNNIKQSVLDVYHAKLGFSGSYECRRTTLYGMVNTKKHIYVQVIVPKIPSFKNPARTAITVSEGKSTKLDCVATGLPTPTITWQKNGLPISTCTRIFTHTCVNQAYLSTKKGLSIVSAQFSTDNGSFTCKATNMAGTVTKTFDVSVTTPPKVSFTTHKAVIYNNKAYPLRCHADKGNPPPKFKWTVQLILGSYKTKWMDVATVPRHTVSYAKDGMSSTVLVPDFVTHADYECTATNKFGTSTDTVEFIRYVKQRG